jgi:cytochrome c553
MVNNMLKSILKLLILGALVAPVNFALGVSRGEEMYQTLTCAACHGAAGKGMVYRRDRKDKKTGKYKYRKGQTKPGFEAYPKLAGQNSAYLYVQMVDIFSGKRNNNLSPAMAGIKLMVDSTAKEGDLQAIADYLSQVK